MTSEDIRSAIVVGSDDPLHTDRDHRVKVQFHWQRGGNSATRQGHPAGDDNAQANAALGAWVRVAAAVAGDNWGSVALPRVGQEVVVEFVHGDIDRPVIVGDPSSGHGLSLRYTGTDGPNRWSECLPRMLRSTSADEIEESMRHWVDPCNNFVFADAHGDIGYLQRGRLPVRPELNGWLPAPG